jgi:hypothetical protein
VSISSTRRAFYRAARFLGDVQAIRRPHKIPKRVYNKLLGRTVVRRMWWR